MESSSSSLSLVSRAKSALHSAAAKAEKVMTDIKSKSDREINGSSHRGSRKSGEQETIEEEVSEKGSSGEAGLNTCNRFSIPPSFVIKQLATTVEAGRNVKSINDILAFVGDPSFIKEKKSLSFSAVKSLVLREKEAKCSSELCCDEEIQTMICSLFDSVDAQRKSGFVSPKLAMTSLWKDFCCAPPESFVARLSDMIGRLETMQKMASFWRYTVVKLRKLWYEGQPIPHMPLDANPDLNSCLLHQQLQVINCCIARKRRRDIAIESLDFLLQKSSLESGYSADSPKNLSPDKIYARISSGDNSLRLGADHPSDDLTMLETGEPIYSPVTQEGPVLTEDLIKETEEFVLRTGSVGAGCSRLLSDMQAFKAANPGCILEDFIRWHSPPDWTEMEPDGQSGDSTDAEGSSRRGRLSRRMQKEGNLWRELWESAKPLPAVKQTPLFDEDLEVESIFTILEDIPPNELFEQLFSTVLCSGLLIAEAVIPLDSNLSKLFNECKDYILTTYQSGLSTENVGDICKVYETVETLVLHPEEAIAGMEHQHQEETSEQQPKGRFRRISLNFAGDRLRRKASKDDKKADEKQHLHVLSNLFDKKPSLFSRKNPKFVTPVPSDTNPLDKSDWTIL